MTVGEREACNLLIIIVALSDHTFNSGLLLLSQSLSISLSPSLYISLTIYLSLSLSLSPPLSLSLTPSIYLSLSLPLSLSPSIITYMIVRQSKNQLNKLVWMPGPMCCHGGKTFMLLVAELIYKTLIRSLSREGERDSLFVIAASGG
eukprot:sb/3473753/